VQNEDGSWRIKMNYTMTRFGITEDLTISLAQCKMKMDPGESK
jgi:hypothetical protein